MTPEQRSMRARIAAYSMHAKHDVKETTRAGTAAFNAKFLTEVDPDNLLEPAERERRAKSARSAHFARMSLRSSMKRAA